MDAEKYVRDEERLNQALNGNLKNITNDIKEVLKKYSIDLMPELAFDVFCFTLETVHLDKFNHQKFVL